MARERAREEKDREQARKGEERLKKEEGEEKSERRKEDEEGHGVWVAMAFGASQPTLALGRQTSNCHVGQD